jgi:galactokinase
VRARGPGRVNLLGEHTDYNAGLCLPFAVEAGVTVEAEATETGEIEAEALEYGEEDHFDAADPQPAEGWRAFVRGTVGELNAAGSTVPGARLCIESSLTEGAGLSSSAALGSALCLALLAVAKRPEPDRRELARLCSRVENDWVGAQTGMLDQMAAFFGEPGHALLLDCRDLSVEQVPLELGGWTLGVADSGSRHAHAESGYNERRRECARAAAALGVETLRDADEEHARSLPEPLDRRVRHVLHENERVRRGVRALRAGDLPTLAALLDASHRSLRDDYEVSVPEVERTVARMKEAGASGARIMGGGFGGAVLALFPPGSPPPTEVLPVAPAQGARLLG